MAVTAATRSTVYGRDGNRCVACGSGQERTVQHRVSKGMGGSARWDSPGWLLTFCNRCNTRLEQDPQFAQEGREKGWKLPRNQQPNHHTPVFYTVEDAWFILDQEGYREPYPVTAEEKARFIDSHLESWVQNSDSRHLQAYRNLGVFLAGVDESVSALEQTTHATGDDVFQGIGWRFKNLQMVILDSLVRKILEETV